MVGSEDLDWVRSPDLEIALALCLLLPCTGDEIAECFGNGRVDSPPLVVNELLITGASPLACCLFSVLVCGSLFWPLGGKEVLIAGSPPPLVR